MPYNIADLVNPYTGMYRIVVENVGVDLVDAWRAAAAIKHTLKQSVIIVVSHETFEDPKRVCSLT